MLYEAEQKELDLLWEDDEAPHWMTIKGYITISKGYRDKGETPRGMYRRVAKTVANQLAKREGKKTNKKLENKFFDYMWNNWMCPASPVLSNTGLKGKGLPISCFGVDVGDSVDSIMDSAKELAALTKNGGGVGMGLDKIRPSGELIKNGANGKTDGIVPFCKIYDSTVVGISQGSTRRGAASVNVDIEHGDWDDFIRIRRPEGDANRQSPNIHHLSSIKDAFMEQVFEGDVKCRMKWVELMRTRMETGESYIMFWDAVNRANPQGYKDRQMEVDFSNICTEIFLYANPEEYSFICCLLSANLVRYDEWPDDLIHTCCLFLNGTLDYFIEEGANEKGLHKAINSAVAGRAIGIGVLGWHSLLQKKGLPFASFESMMLNSEVFKRIKDDSHEESRRLAKLYGEPEWCKGTGMFNTHTTAVAPTKSNSIISGGTSPGIEPNIRNLYLDRTAKGNFMEKNPILVELLEEKGHNTTKIWKKIRDDQGSVQNALKGILSEKELEVYLTAFEISQTDIVRQAAQRQQFIDQGQSLNLFFEEGVDPAYFNKVHLLAWKLGIKSLYYCKSTSGLKMDRFSRNTTIEEEGCASCES